MNGVKGRFLKKLKSIKPITSLKQVQDRVLQLNASNGLFKQFNPADTDRCKGQDQKIHHWDSSELESDIVDVSELIRELEDEEMEFSDSVGDKENIGPSIKLKDPWMPVKDNAENLISPDSVRYSHRHNPLTELHVLSAPEPGSVHLKANSENLRIRQDPLAEIDVLSFRRPDLNSPTLFDPNLLAAFEQALMDYNRVIEAGRKARIARENVAKDEEPPSKSRRLDGIISPLLEFQEKCPPGGNETVILYTTSLRGIRKTFEDCCRIQFLLGNFKIMYSERDVSMHLEFREELWSVLGCKVVPPRLFIRGRYIGGADEVVGLHEQGKLLQLFQGIPRKQSNNPCNGCGGYRFTMCLNCSGSRKIDGLDGLIIQCLQCNENGLIVCSICS